MFLHNYMPALVYKIMLLCCVADHIGVILSTTVIRRVFFKLTIVVWMLAVVWVFIRFSVLSYGTSQLTGNDLHALRWKDTWDFILHKDLPEL